VNASAYSAGVGLGRLALASCVRPVADVAPTGLAGQVLVNPSHLFDSSSFVAAGVGALPFALVALVLFVLTVRGRRHG
jgi:hypothetical protein